MSLSDAIQKQLHKIFMAKTKNRFAIAQANVQNKQKILKHALQCESDRLKAETEALIAKAAVTPYMLEKMRAELEAKIKAINEELLNIEKATEYINIIANNLTKDIIKDYGDRKEKERALIDSKGNLLIDPGQMTEKELLDYEYYSNMITGFLKGAGITVKSEQTARIYNRDINLSVVKQGIASLPQLEKLREEKYKNLRKLQESLAEITI